jgi:hypothetical protein
MAATWPVVLHIEVKVNLCPISFRCKKVSGKLQKIEPSFVSLQLKIARSERKRTPGLKLPPGPSAGPDNVLHKESKPSRITRQYFFW